MENAAAWIEHLKHPLVLAGFGLFMLALLLRPMFTNKPNKLSGRATERLMAKSINYIFILAVLLIIVGFVLSLKPELTTSPTNQTKPVIEQQTSGAKSPAINSGSDVSINYGGTLSSQKKTTNPEPTKETPQNTGDVTQTTQGEKSPAINSTGDVNINYAE